MVEPQSGQPFWKPEKGTKRKAKAKRQRDAKSRTDQVRGYVFARERNICRCCRKRPAESRHELRFRSLGGKITRQNCVAVCGSGTTGCHGHLQEHRIGYAFDDDARGAEGPVTFTAVSSRAASDLGIKFGESIYSPPMVAIESEE